MLLFMFKGFIFNLNGTVRVYVAKRPVSSQHRHREDGMQCKLEFTSGSTCLQFKLLTKGTEKQEYQI